MIFNESVKSIKKQIYNIIYLITCYVVYKIRQCTLNNSYLIWFINKCDELSIKNDYRKMYDFLNTIPIENINSSDSNTKISVSSKAINQYCIQHYQDLLVNKDYKYRNKEWIDKLLTRIIESNILETDRKLCLNDFVILDVLANTGSYYPVFHSDLEWFDYQNANGFQLWYLINNNYEGQGNMFILDDKQQKCELTPSRLNFSNTNKSGKIAVEDNFIFWQTNKTYNNNVEIDYHDDFKMKYLDLKPGDCFVFGRNLWHSSDWRGDFSQRKALNLRIVIKNEDDSITCTGNIGSFDPLKHKLIDNRLYNVNRYDLSGLY
jgi:ectoine hydroxylase-related dioxygenase (phytanoyl-CoA dioxygenase family)